MVQTRKLENEEYIDEKKKEKDKKGVRWENGEENTKKEMKEMPGE